MRLKHFLYFIAIGCALAEIGMALYSMYWGEIINDIAYAEKTDVSSELLIVKSLNFAMPAGVLCLALLLYIRKVDSIGGFGFFVAIVFHLIGLDLNVRAVKKVYGEKTPLESVTWWMPRDDSRPALSPLPDEA